MFTAKLKAPPNGLLRHTGECREMISAGHIERVSESEPSDYENCSSCDDSLGTDVGHLPMKPYIIMHALCDFAKNVDSLLHTMAIESDG